MSDQEAAREAERRGLRCRTDAYGFRVLANAAGKMMARGSTWQEAFARLAPSPSPEPMPPGLDRPCPKCRAAAGQKCRNYRGKVMFTHPVRLEAVQAAIAEPLSEPRGLFDWRHL